jgi:hypothetical protein
MTHFQLDDDIMQHNDLHGTTFVTRVISESSTAQSVLAATWMTTCHIYMP